MEVVAERLTVSRQESGSTLAAAVAVFRSNAKDLPVAARGVEKRLLRG